MGKNIYKYVQRPWAPPLERDLVLGAVRGDKNPVQGAVKGDHWVPGCSQSAVE